MLLNQPKTSQKKARPQQTGRKTHNQAQNGRYKARAPETGGGISCGIAEDVRTEIGASYLATYPPLNPYGCIRGCPGLAAHQLADTCLRYTTQARQLGLTSGDLDGFR